MANIKSAIKRIKTSKRNETKNKTVKSQIKGLFKKAKEFIAAKNTDAGKIIKEALKRIDKAVSKGVIHKKTASRKKSRLLKQFNKSKIIKAEK